MGYDPTLGRFITRDPIGSSSLQQASDDATTAALSAARRRTASRFGLSHMGDKWLWQYSTGMNTYAFANGQPVNLTDPSGLSPTTRPSTRPSMTPEEELEHLHDLAEKWNQNSPAWSSHNQCFDQAVALMDHLRSLLPEHWRINTEGGYNGTPKLGYHHVVILVPKDGNPGEAVIFDGFKSWWNGSPDVEQKCAKDFRDDYPYYCGCCLSNYTPPRSNWWRLVDWMDNVNGAAPSEIK